LSFTPQRLKFYNEALFAKKVITEEVANKKYCEELSETFYNPDWMYFQKKK